MTKRQPLVSIVIPCYNHAQFVQETIQSVIDQDYENIELIIIDDGSKDNSVDVIQEMIPACEERFVRFEFRYRPNKGLCATLNEALEWCEGEYFSPIASDDVFFKNKTSVQVEFLKNNPCCSGVFGSVKILNNKENTIRLPDKIFNFNDIFLHKHKFYACTQLLVTEDVKKVNGYDEDLIIEDWSMWLKLSFEGRSLACTKQLYGQYRHHDGNTIKKIELMHEGCLKVLDKYISHKLYKKAKSKLYLMYASGLQVKKMHKESYKILFEAIKLDVGMIINPSFYWFLIKRVIKK